MKILQVVQKPQRRGAEIFALQLSCELRAKGHDVRIAYLYPYAGPNPLPLGPGDRVLSGREHRLLEKIPGIDPVLLWRLRRLIDEIQPDVVQVNGGRTVKYGAAAAVCQKRRWLLVYRSIGQPARWVRGWLRRTFYTRFVIPRVQGVVAVSTATLQGLRELYRLQVPVVRIPRAVHPEALRPSAGRRAVRRETATPEDAPVVLFVGSLSPEKRLDRLLRIVEQVRRHLPPVCLWLVGDGPLRAALEQQVRALSLEDCVRFIGVQDRVTPYMRAADVVVLTSDTEGMPGVVLEAGWLRRPVVATRVGGVSECVVNGETGLLVEPDDESGFAQALGDLLQRPDRMRELGTRARRWVNEHFTTARAADQYETFYQEVLARRAASLRTSVMARTTGKGRGDRASATMPAVLE
jgi:glycosyltransferase involved in cell wall biosynthesis